MKRFLRVGERYALSKIYFSLLAVLTSMCLYAVKQVSVQQAEPAATAVVNIKPLQIGDTIPPDLWHLPLKVVNHPEGQETVTLNDYRNKLIILDFWATWCVPCVKSLGKLDGLQEQFIDDIAIIPITDEESQKAASFFRKRGWTLPTATRETILKQYFPHKSIPYQVWLKDDRVFAIPMLQYATGESIAGVIKGEPVYMPMNEYVPLDKSKPLFLNGNGGDGRGLYYSSAVSGRVKPMIAGGGTSQNADGTNVLFVNVTADYLLLRAFDSDVGMNFRRISWEVSDSLKQEIKGSHLSKPTGNYERDSAYFNWLARNTFCYNLFSRSRLDAALIREIMKTDLNRYFGLRHGIKAEVEWRTVSCLVLRQVGPPTLLETKGGELVVDLKGAAQYRCVNAPFRTVISPMLSQVEPDRLFVDSTYLDSKRVDITLPTSINDNLTGAQQALAPYGLQLFREDLELDMLVIKEIK